MINSTNITWLKNIKREGGTAWAYMEFDKGDPFELHFPEHFGSNAERPQLGDVILIFQTVNKGLAKRAGTYLTHLVTPLDTKVKPQISTHPFSRQVAVVAKADPPILSD